MKQQTLDGGCFDENEGKELCDGCEQWFKHIGRHWSLSECSQPQLTDYHQEILIGSLLGDGNYEINDKRFAWQNTITRPYLEWLQDQFGALVNAIFIHQTPSDALQSLSKQGLTLDMDVEDCSYYFSLKTKLHPELSFCEDWGYSEDGFESRFPDNFSLTPTILKVWYMGDGSVKWGDGEFQRVLISNCDQIHRTEYFISLFNEIGLDVSVSSNAIRIPRGQTEQFFNYIGEPPTGLDCGFKYKWQYDDYDEYKRLKNIHDSQPYWDRENETLIRG